jgi:hypothetical protein
MTYEREQTQQRQRQRLAVQLQLAVGKLWRQLSPPLPRESYARIHARCHIRESPHLPSPLTGPPAEGELGPSLWSKRREELGFQSSTLRRYKSPPGLGRLYRTFQRCSPSRSPGPQKPLDRRHALSGRARHSRWPLQSYKSEQRCPLARHLPKSRLESSAPLGRNKQTSRKRGLRDETWGSCEFVPRKFSLRVL